jgi:hypothetical protein
VSQQIYSDVDFDGYFSLRRLTKKTPPCSRIDCVAFCMELDVSTLYAYYRLSNGTSIFICIPCFNSFFPQSPKVLQPFQHSAVKRAHFQTGVTVSATAATATQFSMCVRARKLHVDVSRAMQAIWRCS